MRIRRGEINFDKIHWRRHFRIFGFSSVDWIGFSLPVPVPRTMGE